MNANLTNASLKEVRPYTIGRVFRQKTHTEAADLVARCLQYDPKKRPTAV